MQHGFRQPAVKIFPRNLVPLQVSKKVDIQDFSCEKAISITDFQSKYWNAIRPGLVL